MLTCVVSGHYGGSLRRGAEWRLCSSPDNDITDVTKEPETPTLEDEEPPATQPKPAPPAPLSMRQEREDNEAEAVTQEAALLLGASDTVERLALALHASPRLAASPRLGHSPRQHMDAGTEVRSSALRVSADAIKNLGSLEIDTTQGEPAHNQSHTHVNH